MAKQREDSGTGRGETHRWAIDQLEEGTAAVEQDGDHMYEIPRWLVPTTAREGDVLAATLTAGADGEVTISVRVDRAATDAAKAPKRAKSPRSARDPGGDVQL
ncbi:MAG: DUF3006 domain-containing protein [Gemmatimonadaceae bacterium]|nr:DUF3006 domain-containing protein [Gemmatimonadaceae bacterium]NUR21000.1 DUF3006 domain-containing protein [Gemmatimonadaceae bacterium]NUS96262.1 DUF3006 domain-containing protein [Gemmatimonadaceae bacterium]